MFSLIYIQMATDIFLDNSTYVGQYTHIYFLDLSARSPSSWFVTPFSQSRNQDSGDMTDSKTGAGNTRDNPGAHFSTKK